MFSGLRTTNRPVPPRSGRRILLLGLALSILMMGAAVSVVRADELGDGKKALKKGDVDAALGYFQQAVQKDPEKAEAYRYLGIALEKKREWQQALDAFDRSAELDPRSSDSQRGRGSCLAHLGKGDEAVAAYRSALELNRKYPEAALELGDLLIELGRPDEAIDVFTLGLKWGKDTRPYFHEGLGRAEAARGNMKEAEVQILKAREMDPENPQFHVALGDLYFEREIPSLARVSYQQALDYAPDNIQARFRMAAAYEKEGLYNDALSQYKEVVVRSPDYSPAYLEMGELYLLASDANRSYLDDSITNLERYHTLEPADTKGQILLARAYYKKQRRDEARELLEPLAAAGELDEQGHLIYGRVLYENRDFEGTARELSQAGNVLDDVDFRRLAHAYRRIDQPLEADAIYLARWEADSTAGVDLQKASAWLLESGKLHFQLGKKDSTEYYVAEPLFLRKIDLDPTDDEAYYYLGLCYRELNRFEDSVEPLTKAAELNPEKGDRHFWLAVTYDKLDQKEMAEKGFASVAAVDDSTVIGAIARQQLGYILLVRKDYPEAIKQLEISAEISPKQVQTWVWLGQAYQNSGQREKAVRAYRKALELDPNQKDAKKGLGQLSD